MDRLPPTPEEVRAALHVMLRAIGEDPDREGLVDTPDRVIRSWTEIFAGYGQDPAAILATTFGDVEGYSEMILLRDIPFSSMCEHHMMPFNGLAHVAYLPAERVVGLSKLARLVDCYSRRLQIQERMTREVAKAIMLHLHPLGCGVVLEARHGCMTCRGVKKEGAIMVTSALEGDFQNPATRAEFMALIRG
ncbi:MAG: cyclohydrolase [Cyanobacteria bacterium RYN_339]|nr:cyclohydrolase [Cyanobacteria bacterium RYN_339]